MTRRIPAALAALVLAVLAALVLAVIPIAACTDTPREGRAMDLLADPDLDAKIDHLRATGESAPLRELTSFTWDTVHCFYEGTPANEINSAVGATVLRPDTYLLVSGALAVFVTAGAVRPVVIRELVFERSVFDTSAIVAGGSKLVTPGSPSP